MNRDDDPSRRRGSPFGPSSGPRDRQGERRDRTEDPRLLERPAAPTTPPTARGPANPDPPPDPRELAPTLSLPRGGGALKNIGDKFEANAFTGSGAFSVPIHVSPARDLTPSLALGYSTGTGNSPFGIGWALSVPQITRRTDRGLPLYDDARDGDVFILSGAEELVPLLELLGDTWTPKVYTSGNFRVYASPLAFTYSAAEIDPTLRFLDADSLKNLPGALGGRYQLVDLDGEGLPGILLEQAGHWYYKRNEGSGRFGPLRSLPTLPSTARLGGAQRLVDLDGDGQLSLVSMGGPAPGFYDRASEPCAAAPEWRPHRAFMTLPNIDLDAPNVHLLDLNGDGFADILVVEDDRFLWYPSLAKDGYGPALALTRPRDERAGPRLMWTDPQQALYFSDMTGDGLGDIVRVRNGEVVYWPNLGHGRFGRRIVMRGAPVFDRPDRFRVDRVRLGGTDGSGTTDLVYLRPDKAFLWVNQSGNAFGPPVPLNSFPPVDTVSQAELVDLHQQHGP